MPFSKLYKSKLRTVDEVLAMIKSGDEIVSGLGASEAQAVLSRLHEIAQRVEDVRVVTCLPMKSYEYFMNPAYRGHLSMDGWFYSGDMRKMHPHQMVSFIPNHLHLAGFKRRFYKTPTIYLGNASAMDKHGNFSLGTSATYEREMLEAADIVIIEVNKNVPRTFGDTIISLRDIDYIIETDYALPELPSVEPTDKEMTIGGYIADLVVDGATIQLGIGGIPNAVAKSLERKKDLGIHTEMFTDGMVDLIELGVINNSKKTLGKNKSVATFALGGRRLYDYIDDNPAVEILSGHYVNDPHVIGQNYKMVSINTTLQMDLTGQCCSESIGHRQWSGTGGQADTAIGAQKAEDGKSIIALHSTAMVKNEKGEREMKSKITASLPLGSAVSLSRNDVDYVVTEFGVASLRGTSIRERVKRLIAIAHPDFRKELEKESQDLMIW